MIISKKMSAAPFYSIVVLIVGWLFTADDGGQNEQTGLSLGYRFCVVRYPILFDAFCWCLRYKIKDGLISSDLIHVGDYPTFCLFVCENNAPNMWLGSALPKHHVKSNTWS